MKLLVPALAAAVAMIGFSAVAQAKMPVFKATCPGDITVAGKANGNVRINKEKAEIVSDKKNYREAKGGGVVVSISYDDAGGDLTITYTGKDGANGVCQITEQAQPAAASSGAASPSKDEQACLQAVSTTTNNGDVSVLEKKASEANNTFIIGVGADRAKWRCLVKNGNVAEVMSLTNEGAN